MPALKTLIKNFPRLAYKAHFNLSKKLIRAKIKEDRSPQEHNHYAQTQIHMSPTCQTSIIKFPSSPNKASQSHAMTSTVHYFCTPCRTLGRMFNTHGKADCNMPYMVYLIQCKKCNRQY